MGIRLAEDADRAAVETIVRAAYEPWVQVIGEPPLPLVADYGELIAHERVHVLENGGSPENGGIDAVIVLEVMDGVMLVDNVAVRPGRQGRGLGRRLMAFAEFRARSLGLLALRLYTNEKMISNISLFESLGYRETERKSINGRHVVHMRKELYPR
jgi:GNAT superfamily N-acetyltransferase